MTAWDYIVVGGGSTGCVIASRLTEDRRSRVLVLEAGGSDRSLAVSMPAAGLVLALSNPRYDWGFKAEPDPTRDGREDYMPRGKVLGGTSAINGMSYVRGQPEDYDGWAAHGCEGWDFESVLPYFKRSEDNENGADTYHGAGGPLSVSNIRSLHPLSDDYLKACVNSGIERVADINTPPQAGVGYVPATQRRGRRHSTGRAYLRRAMRRRNLRVLTHAHIRRVLFDGKRATGVEYLRRGRTERAEATRAGDRVRGHLCLAAAPHALGRRGRRRICANSTFPWFTTCRAWAKTSRIIPASRRPASRTCRPTTR